MHRTGELISDNRLAILSAAQKGEVHTLAKLLEHEPALINAKTTSKGSTLLHVAAEAGKVAVCQLLLSKGHATNPVDKEGKTPYQRATVAEVRQLLVAMHFNFLLDTYITFDKMPNPSKSYIDRIGKDVKLLSRSDFIERCRSDGAGDMSTCAFGVTSCTARRSLSKPNASNYSLQTFFREDILMTPYYGDLLVIHENEQVIQHLELLEKGPIDFQLYKTVTSNQHETRSFLLFVSQGLTLFPFLKERPSVGDRYDIAEAKKMFIAFALAGLSEYHHQCNKEQLDYLCTLDYYSLAASHAASVYRTKNTSINLDIIHEMCAKYTTALPRTENTI